MPRPMVMARMVAVKALNAMPVARIVAPRAATVTTIGTRFAIPSVAWPSRTQ